jgi:ubiquinone/menaquinone biosynthesis C-methylase UbiE
MNSSGAPSSLKCRVKALLPERLVRGLSVVKLGLRRLITLPRRWITGRGDPSEGWPRGRREFDAFWRDDQTLRHYDTEGRARLDQAVLALAKERPRRLLDVGCGTGRFLRAASVKWPGRPEVELWGVDFSQSAIRRAQDALPQGKFVCAPADATGLPEGYFDVVACMETLEHISSPERALAEILRLLVPGGLLLVSVPDGEKDRTACHVNFWSGQELRRFLAPSGSVEVRDGPEKILIATVIKPLPKQENS